MDISKKNKNPYPGIRNFEPDEDHLFFGRERQIDELLNQLKDKHFLSVIGASGSGKSSLIRAGLIPKLFKGHSRDETREWSFYAIFRPGDDPIGNMAESIHESLLKNENSQEPSLSLSQINNTLRGSEEGLVNLIKRINIGNSKSLIIIDQFEELFRFKQYQTENNKDVVEFINLFLNACSHVDEQIYVVMIMRSDFIDDCTEYKNLFNYIKSSNYLVPRMSEDEIKSAITGPVALYGYNITDRLVNRLLDDASNEPDQLPILQHSLMRTWDYWFTNRMTDQPLDIQHYEAIGTMKQALSLHGEEIYNMLADQRSRNITEKLFKALTELGVDGRGIRRPSTLSEVCILANAKEEEVINVADQFRADGCAFLMPPSSTTLNPDTVLDISHESIMRVWIRLRDWVEEEMKSAQLYMRLAEAAALYQEGKTGLWVNPELQLALRWQQQNKPNITWARRYDPAYERAIQFLDYSKKEYELGIANKENQQKKRLKRARRFAIILGTASLISLFFLIIALNLRFQAESSEKKALEKELIAKQESKKAARQRKEAILQKKISEQQQQIAEQQALITEEQKQYAIEQQQIAEYNAKVATEQKKLAEQAKQAAIKARDEAEIQRKEAIVQKKIAVAQKKIADDEREKAEISKRNADRLRMLALARSMAIQATKIQKTKMGDLPALLALQAFKFTQEFNGEPNDPDIYEALLVVSGNNQVIRGHKDAVREVTVSNKGKLLASCSDDGSVRLWNMSSPSSVNQALDDNGYGSEGFRCVEFSPDDSYLAAGAFSGDILVWNLTIKDPQPTLYKGHNRVVNNISFAKNANSFISTSSDGTVRFWDIENPSVRSEIIYRSTEKLSSAVLNPAGRGMAVASDGGSLVYFENINTRSEPKDMDMGSKPVKSIAFSPDGTKLAAGNTGGLVRIWDLAQPGSKPIDLFGHISWISEINFSPDGQTLATSSYDGTVRIWNYERTQQQPVILKEHDSWVYSNSFTPDGRYLITSGVDKTIRFWTTRAEILAEKVCNEVSRNMFSNEWDEYVGSDIKYEKTCPKLP